MYIEPNTTIRLLTEVPLSKPYKNTIYFSSLQAQQTYFMGKTKHTLTNQTYNRVNRGVCRVERSADVCYDCNYMMFQNASYGSKWFYAFITKVEYVSNVVCEIHFEIDVMQTWFFDYTLKECFVEREHSVTDNAGDNILPEPVELGEYVFDEFTRLPTALEVMAIVLGTIDTDNLKITQGSIIDGVYSGVTYRGCYVEDYDQMNFFLSGYLTSPDNIVTMYMCPLLLLDVTQIKRGELAILNTKTGYTDTVTVNSPNKNKFGEYVAKNNKLLTYPYSYLHINNNSGSSLDLRYEFFKDGETKVKLYGNASPPVKVVLRPVNYKGSDVLPTESITLENFPQCSWNMDSFYIWMAQELPKTGFKMAGQAVNSLISYYTGSSMGGSNPIDTVTGLMGQFYGASVKGDIIRGNVTSGNTNLSHKMQNFFSSRCHITEQYAVSIDNFFTMYGYACRKVKKPNISSRPHWNYVKTNNCTIIGGIPTDDIQKICSVYDNGITFWKNGNEVGNYSLDNSPV